MLDSQTKRKIDSARDILVGKVPDPKAQVEQITTALIYKFMDDMDKEAQALGGKAKFFSNGFDSYGWTHLMDKSLSGNERLDLYVDAITKMSNNPHIPVLFQQIFKDAFLPYRDPQTLSLFLKEIDGFTYEHSENLGNAFEYLLSVLGSQGEAGQFRTPRHIIDFIVEIIDPKKNETILDPACGTAGFLISSYKHIIKHNSSEYKGESVNEVIVEGPSAQETVVEGAQKYSGDKLTPDDRTKLVKNFTGYDISPDMVKLSLVNMYLHGFPNPTIMEYDTLTSEERWNETFDVILANPPFMTPKGGIRPHKRFRVQANRSEVLFVDYIAEHLAINGRAGIIVPEGIIFQSSNAYKDLRKMLVEDSYLWAVVSLPAGVFQPYSGAKTSILLLDKTNAKKTKDILFVKIENDGFDLGAQRRKIDKNDLPQALETINNHRKAIEKGTSLSQREDRRDLDTVIARRTKADVAISEQSLAHKVPKSKIGQSGGYNLSGERYIEAIVSTNQKWPLMPLQDISFFQEGPGILSKYFVNKGFPVINVKNVRDGYLDLTSTKYVEEEMANGKWAHFKVDEGDILLTTSGTIGRSAIVKVQNLPLLMNTSVIRFKSLDEQKLNRNFLFWILRSERFINELLSHKTGMAQFNVGPSHLKKMSIPLPPLEVQKQVVAQIEEEEKLVDANKKLIEIYEQKIKFKISEIWGS